MLSTCWPPQPLQSVYRHLHFDLPVYIPALVPGSQYLACHFQVEGLKDEFVWPRDDRRSCSETGRLVQVGYTSKVKVKQV